MLQDVQCIPIVCVYTYIYIYVCVCMYIHIHIYIYVYIYIYIHIYIYHIYAYCVYIYIYTHTYYEYMTIQNKQKRLVASTLTDLSIGARGASPGDDGPKMGDGRGFTGTQLGSGILLAANFIAPTVEPLNR